MFIILPSQSAYAVTDDIAYAPMIGSIVAAQQTDNTIPGLSISYCGVLVFSAQPNTTLNFECHVYPNGHFSGCILSGGNYNHAFRADGDQHYYYSITFTTVTKDFYIKCNIYGYLEQVGQSVPIKIVLNGISFQYERIITNIKVLLLPIISKAFSF